MIPEEEDEEEEEEEEDDDDDEKEEEAEEGERGIDWLRLENGRRRSLRELRPTAQCNDLLGRELGLGLRAPMFQPTRKCLKKSFSKR